MNAVMESQLSSHFAICLPAIVIFKQTENMWMQNVEHVCMFIHFQYKLEV